MCLDVVFKAFKGNCNMLVTLVISNVLPFNSVLKLFMEHLEDQTLFCK